MYNIIQTGSPEFKDWWYLEISTYRKGIPDIENSVRKESYEEKDIWKIYYFSLDKYAYEKYGDN